MPDWSPHAARRRAQRSVPDEHVTLALEWGCPIRQDEGRVAWHLGQREAKAARQVGVRVPESAIGLAVVVAVDGTVVTVVRSSDRRRLVTHGRRRRASYGD